MQETVKVNYVQYGKSTKSKKGMKPAQSGASGGNYRGNRDHGTSSKPGGKGKKLPFLQDTCYRCGKGRHQKTQDCKAAMWCAEVVERRGTLRKSVSKLNVPHIHWKFQRLPTVLLVNPYTSTMMDNPYLLMWSLFFMQTSI